MKRQPWAVTGSEIIRVLRMQIGSCPHCTGHPLIREHTPRCSAASDLIVRIEAMHRADDLAQTAPGVIHYYDHLGEKACGRPWIERHKNGLPSADISSNFVTTTLSETTCEACLTAKQVGTPLETRASTSPHLRLVYAFLALPSVKRRRHRAAPGSV